MLCKETSSQNWIQTLQKYYRFIYENLYSFSAAFQQLHLWHERPIIDLEAKNPKLFCYVSNLSLIQKLRRDLIFMRKYLSECRIAINEKLFDNNVGARRYLIQTTNMYSIADMVAVENGQLYECLNKMYCIFDSHIRACDICTGKGFLCEVCNNNEVMFPYDASAVRCANCLGLFHHACWIRKNKNCPKCKRIEQRRKLQEQDDDDNRQIDDE